MNDEEDANAHRKCAAHMCHSSYDAARQRAGGRAGGGQITPPTERTGVEPDSGNGPAARSTPITSEENLMQVISQAQPGEAATLGGDIELTQCLTVNKSITLDRNGYTFTGTVPSGKSFLSVTADGAFFCGTASLCPAER